MSDNEPKECLAPLASVAIRGGVIAVNGLAIPTLGFCVSESADSGTVVTMTFPVRRLTWETDEPAKCRHGYVIDAVENICTCCGVAAMTPGGVCKRCEGGQRAVAR